VVSRLWATRLAAPAAFLLGITVAVVLVRAGLDGEPAPTTAVQTAAPTTRPATTGATARTRTATQPEPVFVEIEAGDTLDQLALEHDTTVEELLTLNPGLDPNALQVGQRVRVR
jgi:LysM repeat protein